ncbi:MAG: hypothetical protein IKS15_00245 [Opitutales bacterium]|nr:hypothetical protein [Opitutales bacterium]
MKILKFASLIAFAAAAFSMTGCTSNTNTAHQKSTAWGVYTFEPACYAVADEPSAVVTTDNVSGMELPSGDRLQLFWGLVSIQDY